MMKYSGAFCIAATMLLAACGQQKAPAEAEAPVAEAAAVETPAPAAKIPVTTTSEEARALFEKGRVLADGLKFTDAHDAFTQAAAADPNFAFAHAMVAQFALSNAEFFDALEKAKSLASGASDGEQLIIGALVAAAENDQAGQLAMLQRLVAAYPQDERTHLRLGTFLFGLQDYAGAAEHFGHATEIRPDFATAYNMRGYAYRNLEQFDDAKAQFERYIELIPEEPNPYDSYAELLMETGDYEKSIENYRKALERDPTFVSSYAGIARDYALLGDTDSAIATTDAMLAASRNFAERQNAMFQAITVKVFAGDTAGAEAVGQEMLAEAETQGDKSQMANIHEYWGDMMLNANEPAKAEQHYATALELRQQTTMNDANKAQAARAHQFKTAIAAMKAGDNEAAAARTAEYKAAAEASGTAFEKRRIHMLEGFLSMMNEDYAAAAEHLAKADQNNPIVLYWSAKVQRELGNLDAARDLATRAANRNTLSQNLPFVRADAEKLLGEMDAA
jgi:tetratricopeptide (TPR) repeat protein